MLYRAKTLKNRTNSRCKSIHDVHEIKGIFLFKLIYHSVGLQFDYLRVYDNCSDTYALLLPC